MADGELCASVFTDICSLMRYANKKSLVEQEATECCKIGGSYCCSNLNTPFSAARDPFGKSVLWFRPPRPPANQPTHLPPPPPRGSKVVWPCHQNAKFGRAPPTVGSRVGWPCHQNAKFGRAPPTVGVVGWVGRVTKTRNLGARHLP